MSTSLHILLTVALVAGGILTYHVLTAGGEPSAGPEVAPLTGRELAELDARVAGLEGRDPVLRGANDTSDLQARLRDLEARVRALETGRPRAERAVAGDPGQAPVEAGAEAPGASGEPAAEPPAFSEAQERAIRALVDGAVRERMAPPIEGRVNDTLRRLGIELTAEQRGKLDTAWLAHIDSVRELFRSAADRGADREQVMEDVAAANAKFTRGLAEFLPAGDAEAIGAALTAMGRGPGGPGGPGRALTPPR